MQQNDLLNRSYELAFNFLFAVFPLFFFLAAVLGLFAGESSALRGTLLADLAIVLPPDASHLIARTLHETMRNSGGGKITFGLAFALYAGSAGTTQLMSTLNAAYEVHENRSWVEVHLISLGLTLAMSILIITALLS